MRLLLSTVLISLVSLATVGTHADESGFCPDEEDSETESFGVYGRDDRCDLFEVTHPMLLQNAHSVFVLVLDSEWIFYSDTAMYRLRYVDYAFGRFAADDGQKYVPCFQEKFLGQPYPGHCSGFLVRDDVILTAAHCVDDEEQQAILMVPRFSMHGEQSVKMVFDDDEVYKIKTILDIGNPQDRKSDWALVQLDRPVTNATIPRLRQAGRLNEGEEIYALGYPKGLPLKVAPNASVIDNEPAHTFKADLDVFRSSSGSPVFNESTHLVEGIVVGGAADWYVTENKCVLSRCPEGRCAGESVLRITSIPLDQLR